MNVCGQVASILEADKNYHVVVTYTDQHKGENTTFTNTFFVIVDGEITYNALKR